ncbi:MAG: hypothetical protein ACI837_001478 [Crocinitomicaceae bacterium]|jgi:hypothetical protein
MKNQQFTLIATDRVNSSVRNSMFATCFLLVAFLLGPFLSQSQDLAAFKYSSEQSKGRKIIPFPALQGAVKTMHAKQVSVTSAAAGYPSAKLLEDKKLYVGFRKDVKGYLSKAKSALSSDNGSDASKTDDLEEEVEKRADELEEIEAKIKKLDADMKAGKPKWEAVEDARIRVREIWREAYDEVDDAEDHPENHIGDEPDDDDKAAHDQWKKDLDYFKRYTSKIKSKIQAGYRTHDEQIDIANTSVKNLEEGLRLN